MRVVFSDRKLSRLAKDFRKCSKVMGALRAKLFIKRLNDLEGATTLENVRNLPGRFHELSGDRKGQWACDLDQPYRLIFIPVENSSPGNDRGKYLWVKIKEVEIVEITDYH